MESTNGNRRKESEPHRLAKTVEAVVESHVARRAEHPHPPG